MKQRFYYPPKKPFEEFSWKERKEWRVFYKPVSRWSKGDYQSNRNSWKRYWRRCKRFAKKVSQDLTHQHSANASMFVHMLQVDPENEKAETYLYECLSRKVKYGYLD